MTAATDESTNLYIIAEMIMKKEGDRPALADIKNRIDVDRVPHLQTFAEGEKEDGGKEGQVTGQQEETTTTTTTFAEGEKKRKKNKRKNNRKKNCQGAGQPEETRPADHRLIKTDNNRQKESINFIML